MYQRLTSLCYHCTTSNSPPPRVPPSAVVLSHGPIPCPASTSRRCCRHTKHRPTPHRPNEAPNTPDPRGTISCLNSGDINKQGDETQTRCNQEPRTSPVDDIGQAHQSSGRLGKFGEESCCLVSHFTSPRGRWGESERLCVRERAEDEKRGEPVTDNAIIPAALSLPASLSHRPRRGREEQRRKTLHYLRLSSPLASPPGPPAPVLWYNTLAVVDGAGCNVG